jgi:hypothetical protein
METVMLTNKLFRSIVVGGWTMSLLLALVAATSSARASVAAAAARPAPPVISGPAEAVAGSATTYRFSLRKGLKLQCALDSRPFRACPKGVSVALGEGRHGLRARALDRRGRKSTTSYLDVLVIPASSPVSFSARGARLEGRLYGSGSKWLVLLQWGYPNGPFIWLPVVGDLARQGFRVLAFNLQGECPQHAYPLAGCSGGRALASPDDWAAAIPTGIAAADSYLHSLGASSIDYVATGIAGYELVDAVAGLGLEPRSLALVSSPFGPYTNPDYGLVLPHSAGELATLRMPKLFLESESDPLTAGSSRLYFASTPDPKELAVVSGAARAGDLLDPLLNPGSAEVARGALFDFLARYG